MVRESSINRASPARVIDRDVDDDRAAIEHAYYKRTSRTRLGVRHRQRMPPSIDDAVPQNARALEDANEWLP